MRGAIKTKSIEFKVAPSQFDRWTETAHDFEMTRADFCRNAIDFFIWNKIKSESEGKPVYLNGKISNTSLNIVQNGKA